MKKNSVSLAIGEKTLTLETGELAPQATSSILARQGDTMVLATVVAGSVREDIDYFPLTVEFAERLYAGGKIKGSRWVKREGRPSDDAILTARLIDRSIRPLFPKEYKNEVQVVVTVLSVDGENEPDVLAINAVSAAIAISKIPWKGPVAAVRIGYVQEKDNGKKDFLINPGAAETILSDLDLVVSQAQGKTLMIEAGAREVSEEVVLESLEKAEGVNKEIISIIEKLVSLVGQEKAPVTPNPLLAELIIKIEKSYKQEVLELRVNAASKESSKSDASKQLVDKIFENEKVENPESKIDKKLVAKGVESVFYKSVREDVLNKSKRVDGRKLDEIRPITGVVSVLPRTHGSAIFQRGSTQALTIATLGSPKLEQLIESAEGEETKRYMHHYSMPPYSVGETGRMGSPSRREIGHGALAERALLAVIPSQDKFPYTIRVVSEILSSNGSTSMASVCGSTLALMDAGVPIERPVAGVAMGMVSGNIEGKEKYVLLTDIIGLEDFSGDMDFKVAGTEKGITAIQLDVKIAGLTLAQIQETFDRAKEGRLFILEKMKKVISESRIKVSTFAPKIALLHIPVEKIGEVIGPGGRVIRNIIAETGATVDVEDDGTVAISAALEESVTKALDWVKSLTREVVAGEEFEGEVKRILPFGAFVEFLPGKEGMVHVSQMTAGFVKDPHDVVKIGQKVKIKVLEIDQQGRVNLSMRGNNDVEVPIKPIKPVTPVVDVREKVPSEHPLARQFRRERSERQGGKFGSGKPTPRFRKVHY